jgi:branched-subunit amino acid transport protein
MTTLETWILILGLGAITYLIRFSFLGLLAGRRLPRLVTEALGFVPVTVLPALVAPMIFLEDGAFSADPKRVVAAATGLALGAALRHVVAAIAGAMGCFAALSALGL